MKMLTGAAGKNREALEQAGKVGSRALDYKLGDKCRAADKRDIEDNSKMIFRIFSMTVIKMGHNICF